MSGIPAPILFVSRFVVRESANNEDRSEIPSTPILTSHFSLLISHFSLLPLPPLLSWIHLNPEAVIMSVKWIKDADEALEQAKQQNKPVLIDFSAAPG